MKKPIELTMGAARVVLLRTVAVQVELLVDDRAVVSHERRNLALGHLDLRPQRRTLGGGMPDVTLVVLHVEADGGLVVLRLDLVDLDAEVPGLVRRGVVPDTELQATVLSLQVELPSRLLGAVRRKRRGGRGRSCGRSLGDDCRTRCHRRSRSCRGGNHERHHERECAQQ